MTLRRRLIRALDRRGGRGLLAAAVTRLARRSAPGVRAWFERGMWLHQEHDCIFVDGPALDYRAAVFPGWADQLQRQIEETTDYWFYAWQPHAGDVIVDVGAGRGEDTLVFSKAVGTGGRVLAIEAHPVTFGYLRLFCELNHLDNVRPLNLAITDRAGLVSIETNDGWQANRIAAAGAAGGTQVCGMTLDEVIAQQGLGSIDFLKMNIEGAEGLAIRGMRQTLQITKALSIACHDFRAEWGQGEFFRTKAQVLRAVEMAGFRIVSRDRDARNYVADQVNGLRG